MNLATDVSRMFVGNKCGHEVSSMHTWTHLHAAMGTGYEARGAQTRISSHEVANIGLAVVVFVPVVGFPRTGTLLAAHRSEMENSIRA